VARTSTYLNFARSTEEAFNFYKSVFGTEFVGEIARFGDVPVQEGQPAMSDDDKRLVMNIQLPILGGHLLMGTDASESMGFQLNQGNNVYICLDPDTRTEADRLFAVLSEGGKVEMPLQEMFWGDYFGSLVDQFGVQWMVNCTSRS
jgi:PhnB protein